MHFAIFNKGECCGRVTMSNTLLHEEKSGVLASYASVLKDKSFNDRHKDAIKNLLKNQKMLYL